MDRSTLLTLMVAFPTLGAVNAVIFGLRLLRYLDETPRIETRAHLERYKGAVRLQMYAALAQIVLLAMPALLGIAGFAMEVLARRDLLFVIVPAVVMIGLGLLFKRVEARARGQEVADPALLAERDHVNEVWVHKPFPDW